jgi:hypothetical protein
MSMFGKAFNDVVLPALEGLHERIENIENTMATN